MAKREEDEAREAVAGMRFAGGAPETAERQVEFDQVGGAGLGYFHQPTNFITAGAPAEAWEEFDRLLMAVERGRR